MTAVRSVCVYCGSHFGNDGRHRDSAERLGRLLAQHDIRLVYGGGQVGLMGQIADAVLAGGGEAVGIIPEFLETKEVGHRGVSQLHIVTSMHERKSLMFEMADGFVVLPGGLGTLDEAFEMLTWRQLRLHDKPIVLVNTEGYWEPLLTLIRHVIDGGFAHPDSLALFSVVDSVEEVIPSLRRQPAPAVPDSLRRL